MTVPPGTFFSAAALTLSAVSPVRTFGGAGRVEDDDEDEPGVVVVFDAAPASAEPPTAAAAEHSEYEERLSGGVQHGFPPWV